jgi:hypothetical protein
MFPDYSYEQHYQAVRRCWRFGQTRPVTVDLVATESEIGVRAILERKAKQAETMFTALVKHMNQGREEHKRGLPTTTLSLPSWITNHLQENAA